MPPLAKKALQFLSNLLILFALAAFMILPVRSLYFFSLGLIALVQTGIITRKPLFSRQTWIWLWGILLAEHLIRYAFYPMGLARIAVPMAIALLLVFFATKTSKPFTRLLIGITSITIFAFLGAIAYGFYIPVKKQNSPLSGPVVFLGDSLTAGEDPDTDAAILYTAQLQRSFSTPMINAGRGGDLSSDALERLDKDVILIKPRLVVIMIGGNDMLTPVPRSELKANVSQIVRRISDAGTNTVLVEVPGGFLWDKYYGTYAEISRHYGCYLIGEGMLRHLFVFSHSYTTDGIHLSAKGHARVAQRLRQILRDTYQIP